MDPLIKIYNRPKISFSEGRIKCLCNECGAKIPISLPIVNIEELPIICPKCFFEKKPLSNPLLS